MRQLHEMNKLEQEGAKSLLRSQGWQYCAIGLEGRPGWTKGVVTVEQKDIWFEELS